MSIHLNIDNYGGRSVVPVRCGSYVSGTAFFVTPTKLLTAGHVLAEYVLDSHQMVAVIVEGEHKVCRVLLNCSEPDVAILECVNYHCESVDVLRLLSCRFKAGVEALIVGYPLELGNGEDYFGVPVKNSREKKTLLGGFDRMVVRTDSFGFNSYDGFSGSPVINEFGLVVGVQTDQLYNTLGYVSVAAFKDVIRPFLDEPIEENDDLYDTTPYGLRKAIDFLEEHSSNMIKTRYNALVHVENRQVQQTLEYFCGYGFETEQSKIHRVFIDWYKKLAGPRKAYVDSLSVITQYFRNGILTDDVLDEVEGLFYISDSDKRLPPDYRKELRGIYSKMRSWLRGQRLYKQDKFLFVHGTAGCGKSHLLYREARIICREKHVYMFVGSEFSAMDSPVQCIARLLNWTDLNPLERLNNELLQNGGKKATIIIDALNEGVGTHYWIEQLPILKNQIAQYSQLKLVVSLRTLSKEDQLNEILRDGWRVQIVEGFVNREKAIKSYFAAYQIDADVSYYAPIEEFSNPLFLKLFCETFFSQSKDEREKVLRLPLYRHYLLKRNQEVSDAVDEDPKREITPRYINWLLERSLEQFQCGDVPRRLAYKHSNKLCPYRTWSNSLLRNCLTANLLREYRTQQDDYVDFEFDSMGDYLKAEVLLKRKCDDKDRLKTLLNIYGQMETEYQSGNGNWEKKYNFIRAFLSVWNPDQAIWHNPAFVNGQLTSILLSGLSMRNVRDNQNTLNDDVISQILQANQNEYIEPQLILQNIGSYSRELRQAAHEKLMGMKMADRDLSWTTKVNGLFDGAVYQELIEEAQPTLEHEIEAMLWVETWMLSTSYPYLRAYLIRKLKTLLAANEHKAAWLIESFYKVDDPYILSGLYAAVYGVVVSIDRADFSKAMSELLYRCHYNGEGQAPVDLMVRHWTLKIFELTYHQDSTNDIWVKAQPPYHVSEDLFAEMPGDDYKKDGYFGESYGSKQITHSLFHWDFSRYIIGTNNSHESRVFFKDGKAVLLEDIQNAIAYLIKHRYGWNDELGKYDADVPYQTRAENSMERIGKKYQWIGMYQVYAYLCDTCQMKINIWTSQEGFATKNYPWYAPEHNYFDPTLSEINDSLAYSHKLFDVIFPTSTLQEDGREWLNDETKVPTLSFIVQDKQGMDWVVLHAYSTVREQDDEMYREQFVFYNGMLGKKENYKRLREWASVTNFYGRWMPEHQGSIDFHWNEFPWADSYKTLEKGDSVPFNEGGVELRLVYSAQLQEDFKGMPEDCEHLSTAYMPCADMIEMMGWHTAERGIIRNRDGEIVAINRNIPDEPLQSLLLRKDLLDNYLISKGYFLFWSLLAEKELGVVRPNILIERFTGAAAYVAGEGIDIMQPLRKEPPLPKHH